MPAASKAIKFTWIAKGGGKGGQFSNSTSHDSDTDTLIEVQNFLIEGGKWCPRAADVLFKDGLPGHAQNIFIYNRYNTISTEVTSTLLVDIDDTGGAPHQHAVYRVSPSAFNIIWGGLGELPTGVKPRVNFASVKNRAFMTSGRGLAYFYTVNVGADNLTMTQVTGGSNFTSSMVGMAVLTDFGIYKIGSVISTTQLKISSAWAGPAGPSGPYNFYIGYDVPTIYDGTSTYQWGFPAQSTNLTYQIAGPTPTLAVGGPTTSGIRGTATVAGVGPWTVTWASGDTFDALTAGQHIYMNGWNWPIATVVSPTSVIVTAGTGFGGAGPYQFNAGFGSLVGEVNIAGGPPPNLVAWATGDQFAPAAGGDPFLVVGSPIYIGGQRAIVQTAPTAIALTVSWDLPASAPIGGGPYPYQGNFGPLVWDVPGSTARRTYTYATAYYDPITGHTTNASPVLNVSDGRPNNDGTTITLSGIVTNNDARFTQVLICRTGLNNNSLLTLAVRPNSGGPLKYVDDLADDTRRGRSGPGQLTIERSDNLPPPPTGSFIAYWDQRFWMADNQSIGILFMSKSSQEMLYIAGVAEECWPQSPLYERAIPDSDGKITGLKTVGQNLFVETDLAIYAVVGSGPSPNNYSLVRISAKGSGTEQFATANLPSEDSQSGDVLVHLGNDNRVYFLYGSGGDLSYSYPIQDVLSDKFFPWVPRDVNVSVWHNPKATYVMVTKRNASNPPYAFLYDLDRKIWLQQLLPTYSFTEGLYNGALTQFVGTSPALAPADKAVYLLAASTTTSVPVTRIITQYIMPPETNRLDDKALEAVFVYCDDVNTNIGVFVSYDDGAAGGSFSLTRMDPVADPRFNAYLDAPNARIYTPQHDKIVGRTFSFGITSTSVTLDSKIPAIAALWSYATADEAVKGNF